MVTTTILSIYFTLWCYFVKMFAHVIRKNHICYTNQTKYYIMKKLKKNELRSISGGRQQCGGELPTCPNGSCCNGSFCIPLDSIPKYGYCKAEPVY